MKRAYYYAKISEFLAQADEEILGYLTSAYDYTDLKQQQKNAWLEQIKLLKLCFGDKAFENFTLLFEYIIPRMGRRADCILLSEKNIYVLEFKIGADKFESHSKRQVEGYALDLKTFHEASHNLPIVPILICTEAPDKEFFLEYDPQDIIAKTILTNGSNLAEILLEAEKKGSFDFAIEKIFSKEWIEAPYKPTPTIIEAARALYEGHKVEEISRSDAGAEELPKTREALWKIIRKTKKNKRKSICFVTGVPGAGKTLVGLDLASSSRQDEGKVQDKDHAVFLSGNGPLVDVLREALALDRKERFEEKLEIARREVAAFIQNIHHFRDDALESEKAPFEHVVIFDEAQRAWDREQASKFMKQKRGLLNFDKSEPEFLIEIMDRHQDWAVIICLVGGGQEINTGEAGLQGWFDALRGRFQNWDIYASFSLKEKEYTRGKELFAGIKVQENKEIQQKLHLSVSNRSFRSEKLSAFIHALLDIHPEARNLYQEVTAPDLSQRATEVTKYPLYITRDLEKARCWLRKMEKGEDGIGIIASSGAMRLKPLALNVKSKSMAPKKWFLAPDEDVRSSNFLEEVATEFEVQGLELDYICVAWDANFRFDKDHWIYRCFKGSKWQKISKEQDQEYLKNAYRVLLTRARKGMVIFVPEGSESDDTRKPEYYDKTYKYFLSLGMKELSI